MNHQSPSYDKDFYAWAIETADLLRQKKFDEIDIDNIAEEIESMGKSEKREIISHLSILIAHLLKLYYKEKHITRKYEEGQSTSSWVSSIKNARNEIIDLLEDSPSLKTKLSEGFGKAYQRAVIIAADETGILKYEFSKYCPFSLDDCLDEDFFPS